MHDLSKALNRYPRCRLAHLPTPLEAMPQLQKALGGPRLLVKRDDCTGLAVGGNKTRKLEFFLGDARDKGVDTLITTGGIQSNHARQTAAAAAKLGMDCELVLQHVLPEPDRSYLESGNILLDRLLGANVRVVHPAGNLLGAIDGNNEEAPQGVDVDELMQQIAGDLKRAGRTPLIVPLGASTPVGALGYVLCAQEITAQAQAAGITVDHVVVASGSGGTQAGLIAGFRALGVKISVTGIGVAGETQDKRIELVRDIAEETARMLDWQGRITDDDVIVLGDYVGEGYGYFDEQVIKGMIGIAAREGVLIDPVYTGKAMAGLIGLSAQGKFKPDDTVVFLHTGGSPGVFAYSDLLSQSTSLDAVNWGE